MPKIKIRVTCPVGFVEQRPCSHITEQSAFLANLLGTKPWRYPSLGVLVNNPSF